MIKVTSHFRIARRGGMFYIADAFNDINFDLPPLFYNIFLFISQEPRDLEQVRSFARQYQTPPERLDEFLNFLARGGIIRTDETFT